MTQRSAEPHIVRLLPVLDEEDILERNLRWWQAAGIPTIAVDCGSADASAEICARGLGDGQVIRLERLDHATPWPVLADRLLELAREEAAGLVVLAAADEFFETEDGTSLRQALARDLANSRTRMRFDVMEFCWSTADDATEPDVLLRMGHYRHHGAASSFRAYVLDESLDLSNPRAIGSDAEQRSSPRKYVNRHYPLRSERQAAARVEARRLEPFFIGSICSPLARVTEDAEALRLPAEWLTAHQPQHWIRRDTASRALLARTAGELGDARRACAALRRDVAVVSRRYGEVLHYNERLATGSATESASSRWYDEMYEVNQRLYDVEPQDSVYFPAWSALATRVPERAAILEVGCGSGQLAQLLLGESARSYVGFDFSSRAIELARRRVPHGDFRVADARNTALFDEASYNLVVCTEVLEHVDDDRALLRRISPGVRVLATVPTFDSTTHVRFFDDAAEAQKRYRAELTGLTVTPVELRTAGALLLLDGTTPDRT